MSDDARVLALGLTAAGYFMEERARLGGGRLNIDSSPGKGATLILSLPYRAFAQESA